MVRAFKCSLLRSCLLYLLWKSWNKTQVLVKQIPRKKAHSLAITQTPACLGHCTFPSWPMKEVFGWSGQTAESCRRSGSNSHGLLLEPYTLSPVWPHDPWWGVGHESCNEGETAFLSVVVGVCGFHCEAYAGPAWWGGPRWGRRQWVRWWPQHGTILPWRKEFPVVVQSRDGCLRFDVAVCLNKNRQCLGPCFYEAIEEKHWHTLF